MILYIVVFVSSLCLAYLVRGTQGTYNSVTRQQMVNRVSLGGIFCLLFTVSAARIGIGNDYWQYRTYFNTIYKGQEDTLEWGFSFVVIWMQKIFGYDQYRLIFAFFAGITIFFFLKAIYDLSDSFFLSFYFFFALGNYLNSFTTVRYYLVLAIALYSMKFVIRKDYVRFIFWIVLASFFHKSVLFVIPVYLLCRLPWKKWFYALLPVAALLLAFMPGLFREIVFFFYPFYEGALFDVPHLSYINIARSLGTLFLTLLFYKVSVKDETKLQFYHHLNILALIIFSCASYIPEVSRIGYYLNISQIFLIPGILIRIPGKKLRNLLMVATMLMFALYFIMFLKTAEQIDIRLVPYRSWLFENISNY